MRSQAREAVYKYLFSTLFNQDDEGLFAVLIKSLNDSDKAFATDILTAVQNNMQEYLDTIAQMTHNYNIDRVFNTDKCAILIGMAESDKFPDTPIAVVIDEAVKLSAIYSSEKSTDFVNGILAEYMRCKNNG